MTTRILVFLLLITAGLQAQPLRLWYDRPAAKWTEALPIGNGRIGAMIYGGALEDRFQVNEETCWNGAPREYARKGAYSSLAEIRTLLDQGKQAQADALAEQKFMGLKSHELEYAEQKNSWIQKARQSPITLQRTGLPSMTVPTANGWETAGLEALDGEVDFVTEFQVPQAWQGKDLILYLGRIRDQDITYVNGRPTGTTDGNNISRRYRIEAASLKSGLNVLTVRILNFFDKGGFVTPRPNEKTMMIVPLDDSSTTPLRLSSSWNYKIIDRQPPATPRYQADYQPFVDLWIRTKDQATISNYRRELDISHAISKVTYSSNGVAYTREAIASAPANIIAIRTTASKPGSVNLTASVSTLHTNATRFKQDNNTIGISFEVKDGAVKGTSLLRVQAQGGKVLIAGDSISVTGANEVVFYLAGATNFVNYHDVSADAKLKCVNALKAATNFPAVLSAHQQDYQSLFNRFGIRLAGGGSADVPTDQQIRNSSAKFDPSLVGLYIQYARYLLIASSRAGTQPANLQGIWNNLLTPPWGSKYTSNINLQMNYWGAELFNLSECASPLFTMVDELEEAGKITAREHYNAPGWVLHHNTDIWRGTAPINAANHGIWQGGGGWLGLHLWEHYLFTGDIDFLRRRGYPMMKSAAEFYLKALYPDPVTGSLISSPSNSPENGGLVAGPTMDHQIIRELFRNCVKAAGILHTDASWISIVQSTIPKIAPNKIGKYGQLQEWMKDIDDTSNKHRHVSHLWGVFPGTDINWDSTASFMEAAKKSLIYRGDSGTGWSLAWKANLWARFKDGDHALIMLKLLLNPAEGPNGSERGGVYSNMFDAHPPFQIDGNFGGSAGVAEMLLQSHQGYLELFPALPSALPTGEVTGLCARGGFETDLKWSNGNFEKIIILSRNGGICKVRYKGQKLEFPTQKGKRYLIDSQFKLHDQ